MHYIGKRQKYLKNQMEGHQQEYIALIRDHWKVEIERYKQYTPLPLQMLYLAGSSVSSQ